MSYKILQYEKISVSEWTDFNKTSVSKECMLFYYWYFKDVGFKFVWNHMFEINVTMY